MKDEKKMKMKMKKMTGAKEHEKRSSGAGQVRNDGEGGNSAEWLECIVKGKVRKGKKMGKRL